MNQTSKGKCVWASDLMSIGVSGNTKCSEHCSCQVVLPETWKRMAPADKETSQQSDPEVSAATDKMLYMEINGHLTLWRSVS